MKRFLLFFILIYLSVSLTACDFVKTSDVVTIDDYSSAYAGDVRNKKYENIWLNKETSIKSSNKDFGPIIIKAIYSNCFFATPSTALPVIYKINGTLSDEWCVGDQVSCYCKNVYYNNDRYEADMVTIKANDWQAEPGVAYKPVIYLYPETKTDVSVNLNLNGKLTCTYPEYNNGWHVTAAPDGTLTDESLQTYNYLYWEGQTYTQYDLSKGFCVKGEYTAQFLENALDKLGLTRREANEFIVYWLPMMENNPYNIISFQTDAYTEAAKLEINPTPDILIRVFMAWQKSDAYVDIPEQTLSSPVRNGFTVVEWGGTELR